MITKFEKMLATSNDEVMKKRAKTAAVAAKLASEDIVRGYEKRVNELKYQIEVMSDLGPDTRESLRPTSQNWNPATWLNQLNDLKLQLLNTEIELGVVKDTHTTYFTEDQE